PPATEIGMTVTAPSSLDAYQWSPQPGAEKLVRGLVADFLARNSFAAELSRRMSEQTGTRFYDWVEAIALADSPALRAKMIEVGYENSPEAWTNKLGM